MQPILFTSLKSKVQIICWLNIKVVPEILTIYYYHIPPSSSITEINQSPTSNSQQSIKNLLYLAGQFQKQTCSYFVRRQMEKTWTSKLKNWDTSNRFILHKGGTVVDLIELHPNHIYSVSLYFVLQIFSCIDQNNCKKTQLFLWQRRYIRGQDPLEATQTLKPSKEVEMIYYQLIVSRLYVSEKQKDTKQVHFLIPFQIRCMLNKQY